MIFPICHKRRERRMARRPGFTMLEIALVLTLLVLVAAISWPAFDAWFQSNRLREGVDTVRTHWAQARAHAMQEGRPYRFTIYDATHYCVEPNEMDTMGMSSGWIVEQALPEGVQFQEWAGGASAFQAGVTVPIGTGESLVFWPDGTARFQMLDGAEWSAAELAVSDRRGRLTTLHLRGLTGVVTIRTGEGM